MWTWPNSFELQIRIKPKEKKKRKCQEYWPASLNDRASLAEDARAKTCWNCATFLLFPLPWGICWEDWTRRLESDRLSLFYLFCSQDELFIWHEQTRQTKPTVGILAGYGFLSCCLGRVMGRVISGQGSCLIRSIAFRAGRTVCFRVERQPRNYRAYRTARATRSHPSILRTAYVSSEGHRRSRHRIVFGFVLV